MDALYQFILEVLHRTDWRIEGPKGAALILGFHPKIRRSFGFAIITRKTTMTLGSRS